MVPTKMSVIDTIRQVSLKTLLKNQMEFLKGKDLLVRIARESS